MSYVMNTLEELAINNVNDETAAIAKKTAEYIGLFNQMKSMRDMAIFELELITDDTRIHLENIKGAEYDNGYVFDENGMHTRIAPHTQWAEDHELIRALESIEKAKNIFFKISFEAELLAGDDYGFDFWSKALENVPAAIREQVKYKCLSFPTEQDDAVITYIFDSKHNGPAAFDAAKEQIEDLDNWLSQDIFAINITASDEIFKSDEFHNELTALADDFRNKYGLSDAQTEFDETEFVFDAQMHINGAQMAELTEDLRKFTDFAERHNANAVLTAVFTSILTGEFAVIKFCSDNNKLTVKYCRY